jgi:hypothetical protein
LFLRIILPVVILMGIGEIVKRKVVRPAIPNLKQANSFLDAFLPAPQRK